MNKHTLNTAAVDTTAAPAGKPLGWVPADDNPLIPPAVRAARRRRRLAAQGIGDTDTTADAN